MLIDLWESNHGTCNTRYRETGGLTQQETIQYNIIQYNNKTTTTGCTLKYLLTCIPRIYSTLLHNAPGFSFTGFRRPVKTNSIYICMDREGRKEGKKNIARSFPTVYLPHRLSTSPPSTMTTSLRSSLHGLALGQSSNKPKPKPKPADAAPELERIIVGIDFGYPPFTPPCPARADQPTNQPQNHPQRRSMGADLIPRGVRGDHALARPDK